MVSYLGTFLYGIKTTHLYQKGPIVPKLNRKYLSGLLKKKLIVNIVAKGTKLYSEFITLMKERMVEEFMKMCRTVHFQTLCKSVASKTVDVFKLMPYSLAFFPQSSQSLLSSRCIECELDQDDAQ